MIEASSAPHETAHETAMVKVMGVELPLPAWARTPMAILAVMAVLGSLYHMQSDSSANEALRRTKEDLRQARGDLKNAQDNLRSARDDYEEYVKHTREAGSDFHRETNLTVKYYESDGCIYVLRRSNGVWIKDASKEASPGRSPGRVEPVQPSALRQQPVRVPEIPALIVPALYSPALDQGPGPIGQQAPPRRGACLNPHPGKFESTDGQRRDCWLQVWRRWPDGCQHYQWFNTCSSYWDTDPRGQPVVYWTACTH